MLANIDKQLFLLINSHHNHFFDQIMTLISGQIFWLPYFAIIILLFLKKNKKTALLSIIFLLIAIASADFTSVHLFKNVFQRLRPCHNPDIQAIVHIVNNHCGGKYGFVSSHSANFFAIAMFASIYIKNKLFTFTSFGIAAIVGYSRIYLGVHYPGDVLGGAMLGIFVAFVFYQVFLLLLKNKNKT